VIDVTGTEELHGILISPQITLFVWQILSITSICRILKAIEIDKS
jgi:hypothetical protein